MIVITGATGFIGSVLVWELNKKGITNILCVDPVSKEARPGILDKRKYRELMGHEEFLNYLKKGPKIQWIIHMGACSSTTEMNVDFLKENNTLYTKKLFNSCLKHNISFIYASSGACYGNGHLGFDDQTDPELLKPLNPYGDSKINFDRWVLEQKIFPKFWMGLRFFNVYGPNEYYKKNMSSVIFKAYHQIKANGTVKLFRSHNPEYKDGEQLRDFIYVKDISRWIMEILEGRGCSGIYNMGFGEARSWLDLAKNVFKNMNINANIKWMDIPENIRSQYQYFTNAEMQRFFNQGFSQPQWSLEKGIADYIQYLKKEDPFL